MPNRRVNAFGLIEVSLLLLVFGLITVTTIVLVSNQSNNTTTDYESTENKLDEIERALIIFLIQNGRLPCPNDITTQTNDADFGLESIAFEFGREATCQLGGLNSFSVDESHTLFQGAVPHRTLDLSDEFAFDAWDNKIEYAVVMPFAYPTPEDSAYITIRDQNGNNVSNVASYFIVSHGKNEFNSFDRFGNSQGSSSNSLENQNSFNGANNSIRNVPTASTAQHNFDNIARFKEQQQLIDDCNLWGQNICDTMFEEEEIDEGGGECSGPDAGPECD